MAKGAKVQDDESNNARQHWATPRAGFDTLNREFGFTIDACAAPWNAKLPRFWSEKEDGLAQDWKPERPFYNPPYNDILPWVEKAYDAALRGCELSVGLLPPRTDAEWFMRFAPFAVVEFFRGRVQFEVPPEVLVLLQAEAEKKGKTFKVPSSNAEGSCLLVMTPEVVHMVTDRLDLDTTTSSSLLHFFYRDAATFKRVALAAPKQMPLTIAKPAVVTALPVDCRVCGAAAHSAGLIWSSLANGYAHPTCVDELIDTLRAMDKETRAQAEQLLRGEAVAS